MNSDPKPIDEIFSAALEIESHVERGEYLDQVCGDDAQLRKEIEQLLVEHLEATGFMAEPAAAYVGTIDLPIVQQLGTYIGPYKLIEEIGEGGMGVVYLAHQRDPVRRKVALKIIKPGMDTREVIARFEAERQALAMMDHPNIAKVYEAGSTESGRPFFVMELVNGVPITEYCDDKNLTTKQRLELFVSVCNAVQHAHHKGIIHRDIKPSNILVTLQDGVPAPKIIDFGIAKATNQELTTNTLFTGLGQMIGTPMYMSPEQAERSSLNVDTRSDIYSLGVLLYELLTGTTPFDRQQMKEAGLDGIRRMILEEEPQRPSTRISTMGNMATTTSDCRKTVPAELRRSLQQELDWIVMKSLEKDRTRRYQSATDFSRDVQRHLSDEPVEACPPSTLYRLQKYVRRNRVKLLITGVLTICILSSIALVATVRHRASKQVRVTEAVHAKLARIDGLRGQLTWDSEQTFVWAELNDALSGLETLGNDPSLPSELNRVIQETLDRAANEQKVREAIQYYDTLRKEFRFYPGPVDDEFEYVPVMWKWVRENDPDRIFVALKSLGIQLYDTEVGQITQTIASLPTKAHQNLIAVLDDAVVRFAQEAIGVTGLELGAKRYAIAKLNQIIQEVDKDPWRQNLRGAISSDDVTPLVRLAQQAEVSAQAPRTLLLLARELHARGETGLSVQLLEQSQQVYPGHQKSAVELGYQTFSQLPEFPNPSVSQALADVAFQPRSYQAMVELGRAFWMAGDFEQSVFVLRKATEMDPDRHLAFANLSVALASLGRLAEAENALEKAKATTKGRTYLSLDLNNLAIGYYRQGDSDKAIALHREALARMDARWIRDCLRFVLTAEGQEEEDAALGDQENREGLP